MVGTTDNPIQIDEASIAGRRKYNRGRMLNGDNAPLSEENDAEQENNRTMGVELMGIGFMVLKKTQTVGSLRGQKNHPKARDKCLNTFLLKEVKS
ncbi:hypothetical protein E2C01_022022 [Portunus trituberculatus]|uniref:Uncharacterized protein n=1 Tax=Portunus trituberculatus TaxID=210409 RepID=A0A5B7E450_PORTR|nr:hypothetical protein [Portunus trituberculatus]